MKSEQLFRSPNGRTRFVRTGFSWPAFLFGPMWAFLKRDWLLFFALLITFVSLVVVDEFFVGNTKNIVALLAMLIAYLAYMIVCGVYGNRWLAASLIRRGYVRVDDSKI